MPPFKWSVDYLALVSAFEKLHACPEAGALVYTAVRCVDSLHYLQDIDRLCEANPGFAGHSHDTIDVAHVRWATSTCVTALDLCAAALGRAKCGIHGDDFELALPHLDLAKKGSGPRRAQLPPAAIAWVDATLADPDYSLLKEFRDELVHSRVLRHFTMAAGGPHVRLKVQVGAQCVPVGDLVDTAVRCATDRVTDFLKCLPNT